MVHLLVIVLGLLVTAHLAVRRFAPNADGTLLPLAALLNGIGYAMIVRLDEGLAKFQAAWTFLGIVRSSPRSCSCETSGCARATAGRCRWWA